MKIYTKKGDKGYTDLIGKRVSKTDITIWVNGTLDELTSYLSYSKIHINENEVIKVIDSITHSIYLMSYEIAGGPVQITQDLVEELEKYIDDYNEKLPPLKEFISFDINEGASLLNIARTITRKAERYIVSLTEDKELNENIIKYLNRLSDLLFVLARFLQQ